MKFPNLDLLSELIQRELPRVRLELPTHFPNVPPPHLEDGTLVRWAFPDSNHADYGVVLGRFYNYAPHHQAWMWCYLIWLDKQSPSAAWIVADTAWEDDLEPLDSKEA